MTEKIVFSYPAPCRKIPSAILDVYDDGSHSISCHYIRKENGVCDYHQVSNNDGLTTHDEVICYFLTPVHRPFSNPRNSNK